MTACASSDGGGTGGTGVTSRNVGQITSTNGAVSVNSVAYDASAATVTVDQQSASTSALHVGMVVSVDGHVDDSGTSGTASRIDYNHTLHGQIEQLDAANSRMTVLGQTVLVDQNTQFEQTSWAELVPIIDVVEVSGFRDANGAIRATYIKKDARAVVDIEGVVSALDSVAQTFEINSLLIYYRNATLSGATTLANGQYVEVTGISGAGGFTATRIEVEGRIDSGGAQTITVEGYITSFRSTTDFNIDRIAVTTTAQTRYDSGTQENLQVNARITLSGTINASGVLVADRIRFK